MAQAVHRSLGEGESRADLMSRCKFLLARSAFMTAGPHVAELLQ